MNLVSLFSKTIADVQAESKFYFSLLRTNLLEEYSVRTIFPIHLQLLAVIMCLFHWLRHCCIQCCQRRNQVGKEVIHDNREIPQLNRTLPFVRSKLFTAISMLLKWQLQKINYKKLINYITKQFSISKRN